MKLIITCEHGGNKIPSHYKPFFTNENILNSHRGLDIGALDVFNYLKPLANYSNFSITSRLLIELNRSLHHKNLFSEFSINLPQIEKEEIIKTYYEDYRNKITNYIANCITNNENVVHLSIHSFTPVLNANKRYCDIGLLYDSRKPNEKQFALQFKKTLKHNSPNLNIRYNYPYLGKADGFTTALRKQFPDKYIGIEIEINQSFSLNNKMPKNLKNNLFNIINKLTKY